MTKKRALSQREISRMISENIGMDVLDVEDVLNELGKIACTALSEQTGVVLSGLGAISPNTSPGNTRLRRAGSFRFKPARELRLALKTSSNDHEINDPTGASK